MNAYARGCAVCCSLILGWTLPGAAQASAGESWEFTMSMDSGGHKVPMMTEKVCAKPESINGPMPSKECKISNLKPSGSKMTYHFSCTGAMSMEGDGEGQRKGDSIEVVMHAKMPQGDMTMYQSGRKLGDCANPTY